MLELEGVAGSVTLLDFELGTNGLKKPGAEVGPWGEVASGKIEFAALVLVGNLRADVFTGLGVNNEDST
jgi:hypothetical protein